MRLLSGRPDGTFTDQVRQLSEGPPEWGQGLLIEELLLIHIPYRVGSMAIQVVEISNWVYKNKKMIA